jgi:predicted MFS family arabinose efflux permease
MVSGGFLAELFGWRVALFAVGIPGIALGALVWLTLREPRRAALAGTGASAGEPAARPSPRPQATFAQASRALLASPTYRLVVCGAAVWAMLAFGKTTWTAILFARVHGLSPAEVGLWFGLTVGLAGVLGTWLGGLIGDRFAVRTPRWLLLAPAAAITLSIPLLAWGYAAQDWRLALALIFLPSVASSMYYGPTYATIQMVVRPDLRAFSVSVLLLFANLFGAGLGPLAFGIMSDALAPVAGIESVRWVLIVGAVLGAAAAVIYWAASRTLESEIRRHAS